MTLLENTYRQLRNAGLVDSAEAFSSTYLTKSKNWYAYQKHTGRDYSVDAAIQCLRGIRDSKRKHSRNEFQHLALDDVEKNLMSYLKTKHMISDVVRK